MPVTLISMTSAAGSFVLVYRHQGPLKADTGLGLLIWLPQFAACLAQLLYF